MIGRSVFDENILVHLGKNVVLVHVEKNLNNKYRYKCIQQYVSSICIFYIILIEWFPMNLACHWIIPYMSTNWLKHKRNYK